MITPSLQELSDNRVARLLASACIVLYVAIFTILFAIGTSNGSSPEQLIGLTFGDHSDPTEYQHLAETMLTSHRFALTSEAPAEFARIPGYPAFVAAVLAFFGTLLVVPLIHVAFAACTVALIYLIGVRHFPRSVALFAASIYMLDPIVWWSTSWVTSEPLFMLLFIGSIFALETPSKRWWLPYVTAGILLGLSAYVRHASFYLGPIIAAIPLLTAYSFRIGIRNALVFLITVAIVVCPWMLRNYALSGNFAFSSFPSWQLFAYNMALFEQVRSKSALDYQQIQQIYSAPLGTTNEHLLRQFTYSDALRDIAMEKILAHPFQYLIFHAVTTLKLFVSSSIVITTYHLHQSGILAGDHAQGPGTWGMLVEHRWRDALAQIFNHLPRTTERLFMASLYLSTICTAILALFRRNKESVWTLCVFVLINVYAAMIGPGSDDTRYRMPIEPFLLMLGGYGFYLLFQSIKMRLRVKRLIRRATHTS